MSSAYPIRLRHWRFVTNKRLSRNGNCKDNQLTLKSFRKFPALIPTGLVVLALLYVSLRVTYDDYIRLRECNLWVANTHATVERLQLSRTHILEAETGQRGYLLTGDPTYLVPFSTGSAAIIGDLTVLGLQLHDNPRQQRSLSLLRYLVSAKLSELNETVVLSQDGKSVAALHVVRTNRGKLLMDDITHVLDSIQTDEITVLNERMAATDLGR